MTVVNTLDEILSHDTVVNNQSSIPTKDGGLTYPEIVGYGLGSGFLIGGLAIYCIIRQLFDRENPAGVAMAIAGSLLLGYLVARRIIKYHTLRNVVI